ncbi:MAG: hypothetical protein K9I36_07235 [Bacteroidia bacterium]|nr:hypothetical protein [Bacteroidia bacterium]MCF8426508.1 hypothetical protein [Bacteroidia bacterium]
MDYSKHSWSFSSVGGVKRVNLESGSDLLALEYLDQKLWTALSCPIINLEIDSETLKLVDQDKDGQIRVPEIIAAVKWACSFLKDPSDLLKQNQELRLSSINTKTEEGQYLLKCAQLILSNLGKPEQETISANDTSDFVKVFAGTPFNGDGIITEDSSNNDSVKGLINQILSCGAGVADRGGKLGINAQMIEDFYAACEAYAAWQLESQTQAATILPFGANTAAANAAWDLVQTKVADYFLRCRLAAFDPQTTETLNQLNARVEAIAAKDLNACKEEISGFPLARIMAGKFLPLQSGLNPAWEDAIVAAKTLLVDPIYPGKTEISESEWNAIGAKLNAYKEWMNAKAGASVEALGLETIQGILASGSKAELLNLVAKDMELEEEALSMIKVDQLVKYHRDLFKLLKNFVTFYDFYAPETKAIFQAGTLFIDQRSCDLCIKVNDMGKHNTMVSLSGLFWVYCNCISKTTGEQMIIAAALTTGEIDDLIVGRNALFYDRNGLDWDATVIKVVDNPISIRQAFWSPYRKISRFINTQVNKMAAAQESKVDSQTTGAISKKADAAEEQAKVVMDGSEGPVIESPAPFDIGKFVGIFAAISLALGAIGAALTSVLTGFLGLVWWKMPLAILGILLLISTPSMVIAFLKLRRRNLAPILDANGWAINAKATVNIPFGRTLTQMASLPPNSKVNLNDPFTKKGVPLWKILVIISLLVGAAIYLLIHLGIVVL